MQRPVDAALWDDPDVRSLSHLGMLAFFYLWTCRHGHVSGLYYLPAPIVAHDLKLSTTAAIGVLGELEEPRLAHHDHENGVVFVRWMLRQQGRGSNKNLQSAADQIVRFRRSPLVAELLAEYPEVQGLLRVPLDTLSNTLSIGYRYPSGSLFSPSPASPSSLSLSPSEGVSPTPPPTPSKISSTVTSVRQEMEWRVRAVWQAHLAARAAWWETRAIHRRRNNRALGSEDVLPPAPTLTFELCEIIGEALRTHDADLLGRDQRDEWAERSAVRAAGQGLFLSDWHIGRDAETGSWGRRTYLEPWRPWQRQKGKPDPVPGFAQLEWEFRAR